MKQESDELQLLEKECDKYSTYWREDNIVKQSDTSCCVKLTLRMKWGRAGGRSR